MNRRTLLLSAGAIAVAGSGAAAVALNGAGTMDDYTAGAAALRAPLPDQPEWLDIVRMATLAANGHNTQPWRFRIAPNRIDILPDLSRRTPVVDPDDHHLFASLGCAAANLDIAARAAGHRGTLRFDGAGDASVAFEFESGAPEASPLLAAITRRQSTRADFDGRSVPAADLASLAASAAVPGVDLILITDRPQIERVQELVIAGNTAQMADAAFVRELKDWIRFSPKRAAQTGDGLFAAASGNPTLPDWLGELLFGIVFTPAAENEKYARQIRSSAGLAVFVSERDDKDHWVRAGESCQRFALQATTLGLKHAFVNQPVEVSPLRPELAALLGVPGRRPDLVMRFGYGPDLPNSYRRPVADVVLDA